MRTISLDVVLNLASLMGIELEYKDLHARNPQLEAYAEPPRIVLDKSFENRNQEHRVVLAHELGHIVYPPQTRHYGYHRADYWSELDFPSRDTLAIAVARDERIAMKYATELLIPTAVFWEYASEGLHLLSDWLEEFNVPQWFFDYKVGFIRDSQPNKWYLKWRDIVKG